MKQLSIEEKAKAYDEAIERAKQHCADYVVETIFPELKESEDEKIRKAIVELVHDTTGDSLWVDYGVHKEDALAWLEKQGEQQDVSIQINPSEYINDMGGNGCYLKNTTQKPTEDVNLPEFENYLCLMLQKFRTKGMCTNGEIIDFVEEHSQKLRDILAKPAWSEEDEESLLDLIKFIENWKAKGKDFTSKLALWTSNEQKCDRLLTFLKSLRPQNTWKPSDEQMFDLKCAADSNMDVLLGQSLLSLYNDLKKLREE